MVKCEICSNNPFKYKCPTCLIKYCSLVCYKLHKENPCQKPVIAKEDPVDIAGATQYKYSTEDTVSIEKLQALGMSFYSLKLKECLANPHVRNILNKLVACKGDADAAVKEAMQEPIFLELATACLKIVEPGKFE
nr:EOG090X0JQ4 [Sida crystallina]